MEINSIRHYKTVDLLLPLHHSYFFSLCHSKHSIISLFKLYLSSSTVSHTKIQRLTDCVKREFNMPTGCVSTRASNNVINRIFTTPERHTEGKADAVVGSFDDSVNSNESEEEEEEEIGVIECVVVDGGTSVVSSPDE